MIRPHHDGPALGAVPDDSGAVFSVWAPYTDHVRLDLEERSIAMTPSTGGYHMARIENCAVGQRYGYRFDSGPWLPDPASRSQPDGIHGRSAVVPLGGDDGRPPSPQRSISDMVISEIHVGTFTEQGTFEAAIGQLDRLVDVGINTIELMPVNQFPGTRNWGYDGVFAFAAQHSYGGRSGLVSLVDAAHERGLSVLLDVVHNHLGPEGNVLGRFGPYFTDTYETPWGPAINVAGDGSDAVRRYFIESAVEWVRDVGVDGLRLDAVHSIVDPTAVTFMEQLTDAVHETGNDQDRQVAIIAESSSNDPRLITDTASGGFGCDGVWNDDYHHALRVTLTGERSGYYLDYTGLTDVIRCLRSGWSFDGRFSHARGRTHGRPLRNEHSDQPVPFDQLVVCAQNHDQIGNRAAGERLDSLIDADRRSLAAAAVLLAPFTPMLFMGEEYGETAPFPFFVDHGDPAILQATRQGRRREFPDHDPSDIPDPADPATRRAAILSPQLVDHPHHAALLRLHRDLISVRETILPSDPVGRAPTVTRDQGLIRLGYGNSFEGTSVDAAPGSESVVWLNFGNDVMSIPAEGPWEVLIDTAWSDYGGAMDRPTEPVGTMLIQPWTAVAAVPKQPRGRPQSHGATRTESESSVDD